MTSFNKTRITNVDQLKTGTLLISKTCFTIHLNEGTEKANISDIYLITKEISGQDIELMSQKTKNKSIGWLFNEGGTKNPIGYISEKFDILESD